MDFKRKGKVNRFNNQTVWQKSMDSLVSVYNLAKMLPKDETYALSDQRRRVVASIFSNIAEGSERNSNKEYIPFLYIAQGVACEVKTQIIIAQRIDYLKNIEENIDKIIEIKKCLMDS